MTITKVTKIIFFNSKPGLTSAASGSQNGHDEETSVDATQTG